MGGKSIIKNGDFEDNDIYATPWTCPGNCGINTIAKAKQPEHGNNFAYLVGQNTLGQITTAKKGEVYNLTYYAYGFTYPPADPNALVGWGLQFGTQSLSDNSTSVFSSNNVQPQDWPFWSHTLNASDDGIALTYLSDNLTVFFLDNVHMTCVSCPAENHTGSIVGGVVGGLAGLGVLVLGAAFLYLRVWKPRRAGRPGTPGDSASMPTMAEAGGAYSTSAGTPSYGGTTTYGSSAGRYSSPQSPGDTINILSSSQGHGGRGESGTYSGAPEIHDGPQDLTQPDVYPAFRGGER